MKHTVLVLSLLFALSLGITNAVADTDTAPGISCVRSDQQVPAYYYGTVYNNTPYGRTFYCPIQRTIEYQDDSAIRSAQITVLQRGSTQLRCRIERYYQLPGSTGTYGWASDYKSPRYAGNFEQLRWNSVYLGNERNYFHRNYNDYFRCYVPGNASGNNYLGGYVVSSGIIPD